MSTRAATHFEAILSGTTGTIVEKSGAARDGERANHKHVAGRGREGGESVGVFSKWGSGALHTRSTRREEVSSSPR